MRVAAASRVGRRPLPGGRGSGRAALEPVHQSVAVGETAQAEIVLRAQESGHRQRRYTGGSFDRPVRVELELEHDSFQVCAGVERVVAERLGQRHRLGQDLAGLGELACLRHRRAELGQQARVP